MLNQQTRVCEHKRIAALGGKLSTEYLSICAFFNCKSSIKTKDLISVVHIGCTPVLQ